MATRLKSLSKFLDKLRPNIAHNKQKQYNHQTTFRMKRYCAVLPYQRQQGTQRITRLRALIYRNVTRNVKVDCVYNTRKLGSCFPVKNKTRKKHKQNIYKIKCSNQQCLSTYIDETARSSTERVSDHMGRDKKPTMYRNCINKNHEHISVDNFEVIGDNHTWKIKRKIAEALLIKEYSRDLNEQGQSIPLKLLN